MGRIKHAFLTSGRIRFKLLTVDSIISIGTRTTVVGEGSSQVA